jgi:Flp pilus assembly protein CpaB
MQQPAPVAAVAEKPKEQKFIVPLSVVDLPAGRTVVLTDIISVPMTQEEITKAKFPLMVMDKVSQITGRMLKEAHKRGRPFEPSDFYPAGMGPNVADMLLPGERAYTVNLDHDGLNGSFIMPGTIVDVIYRSKPDPKADIPDATVTLLSHVRVLATGLNTLPGTSPKKEKNEEPETVTTVTLAVDQEQARALKVVEGRGTMTLVLRNAKDEELAKKGGPTTLQGMLGMKEPSVPLVTEMYKRGRRTTMTWAEGSLQKIKLDPPYGLPIYGEPKNPPGNDLEVWPAGGWGGLGGWGGPVYGGIGTGAWGGYGGYGGFGR